MLPYLSSDLTVPLANKPADVVRIPPRKVVKFKPGRLMKQAVLGDATQQG